MRPVTSYGNPPRYVNEIDIVASTPSKTDDGIDSLRQSGPYAKLDWTGVKLVEEDWRMSADGTFQRQRFFRNARWMNESSRFLLYAVDTGGKRLGSPVMLNAGADDRVADRAADQDDFFVRRFAARQVATGCKTGSDCSHARFTAELLVQVRYNRNLEARTITFPQETAALGLEWSQNPALRYKVAVQRRDPGSVPYGYGFQVSLDLAAPPANQRYFLPGEPVKLRATFRDGAGRRLHDPGKLPTYGQFMRDQIASGLRYYDPLRINSTVYYALKHRESNILVALAGPVNKLQVTKSVLDTARLLDAQALTATPAKDGYTGVFAGIPPFAISVGGRARWDDPVSDAVTFTLPQDALPGTYVAAIKARREFGGEALNRAATVAIQVGTAEPSTYTPATSNCQGCHQGASGFDVILHGVTDRRACFGCHMPLGFEADNALDYRVHAIHSRSRRVAADVRNCVGCHVSKPAAPARGLRDGAGFGRPDARR
jgi:hypothetical protein